MFVDPDILKKVFDIYAQVRDPFKLFREVTLYEINHNSMLTPKTFSDSLKLSMHPFVWRKVYHNGKLTTICNKNAVTTSFNTNLPSYLNYEVEGHFPNYLPWPENSYYVFKEELLDHPLLTDIEMHQVMGLFNDAEFRRRYSYRHPFSIRDLREMPHTSNSIDVVMNTTEICRRISPILTDIRLANKLKRRHNFDSECEQEIVMNSLQQHQNSAFKQSFETVFKSLNATSKISANSRSTTLSSDQCPMEEDEDGDNIDVENSKFAGFNEELSKAIRNNKIKYDDNCLMLLDNSEDDEEDVNGQLEESRLDAGFNTEDEQAHKVHTYLSFLPSTSSEQSDRNRIAVASSSLDHCAPGASQAQSIYHDQHIHEPDECLEPSLMKSVNKSTATSASCPSLSCWMWNNRKSLKNVNEYQIFDRRQQESKTSCNNYVNIAGRFNGAATWRPVGSNVSQCAQMSNLLYCPLLRSTSSSPWTPDNTSPFDQSESLLSFSYLPSELYHFHSENKTLVVRIRTWEEYPLESLTFDINAVPNGVMKTDSSPWKFHDMLFSPQMNNLKKLTVRLWPINVFPALFPSPMESSFASRLEYLDLSGCYIIGSAEQLTSLTNLKTLILYNVVEANRIVNVLCTLKSLT